MLGGYKNEVWKFYYENGKIEAEGAYQEDEPVGKWRYYSTEGKLKEERVLQDLD